MKHLGLLLVVVLVAGGAAGFVAARTSAPSAQAASLPQALTDWAVIDLTQPISMDIPLWPGDPEVEIEPWATYAEDDYFINRISIGEHSATHWGTPNTFIEGARSAEMIPAAELVVPAVVIDVREQGAADPDYRVSIEDVEAWEAENGPIPEGSVVIIYTGWQEKWDDAQAFLGLDADEVLHWPGFGADTVEYLIAERGIVGLGTDTHGADAGNDEEFGASFAMYDADGMILECLAGLDQMPPTGATLVVGGWPIVGGSGSPARVLAFVPPAE
ncbi:cyclase family protein [Aggregatilinea lenta]|uniref:cyclase family protein n=1 Tax=Aggregatilinea lenta TaxID=913108 RepID=UPI000E5B9843|nr:cyclase family protein [Aggregatilinea lenta]